MKTTIFNSLKALGKAFATAITAKAIDRYSTKALDKVDASAKAVKGPSLSSKTGRPMDQLQYRNMCAVIGQVKRERAKQHDKWGEQNHTPMEFVPILMEEVGEAAKAALEIHFKGKGWHQYESVAGYSHLRDELIQVAAVAVQMVEALERVELLAPERDDSIDPL